jgi:hypothetical protein
MDMEPTELPRLTDEQRRRVQSLSEAVQEHVGQIQSELSTFLTSNTEQDSEHGRPISAVTVTLRTETREGAPFSADAGVDAGPYCMTVQEICGKGPTSYIYCTVTYCVDVISGAG